MAALVSGGGRAGPVVRYSVEGCGVAAAVNPMAPEGKDVVMSILREDGDRFYRLVDGPATWELQTRCPRWQVRDLAGT